MATTIRQLHKAHPEFRVSRSDASGWHNRYHVDHLTDRVGTLIPLPNLRAVERMIEAYPTAAPGDWRTNCYRAGGWSVVRVTHGPGGVRELVQGDLSASEASLLAGRLLIANPGPWGYVSEPPK